jgi:hypothetical protein
VKQAVCIHTGPWPAIRDCSFRKQSTEALIIPVRHPHRKPAGAKTCGRRRLNIRFQGDEGWCKLVRRLEGADGH